MAITLFTGLPGHGKSLRLVYELVSEEYAGRPRYVHGVDELDYDKLNAQDFDPKEWQDLPDGSVIVVDECYKHFPARSSHQRPPDYIEKFAEHRHQGKDFLLACQDPMQIDPFLRKLVDRHVHMKRSMGMERTAMREFQGVHPTPGTKRAIDDAVQSKQWAFPKKLFGLYKSANAHTVKRRLPLKAYGAGLVVLGAIGAIAYMGYVFMFDFGPLQGDSGELSEQLQLERDLGRNPAELIAGNYEPVGALPGTPGWEAQVEQTQALYFRQHIEALEGLPWTSPYYAEVLEPVTFPKPRCVLVMEEERCICHTQQSTRMQLTFDQCSYFATNGFFDPTKEDQLFHGPEPGPSSVPATFIGTPTSKDSNRPQTSSPDRAPWTNWNERRR